MQESRAVKHHGRPKGTDAGTTASLPDTFQDISDLSRVEDHLLMLKAAVDCLPVGITLSDFEGNIVYVNPAEAAMHGYQLNELIEKKTHVFAPLNLRKPYPADNLNECGLWRRETVNMRKNGELFPVHLSSVSVKDATGRCLGLVTVCEDISNRKKDEDTIADLAYFDPLTRLPNRRMFLDRLQNALAMALRHRQTVSLLFIDLDNFKDINDSKGHDFGDKLLQEVAQRLKSSVRDSDTLARLGGDEFVVVLPSSSSRENPAATAQRMLAMFSSPFTIEEEKIFCNASIGIALYPNDGMDVESLLKCADTAMYHAKGKGRSQYQFFSPEMNKRIMHRVRLEKALRQGLEKGEFFLHYQPKWNVTSGRIVGVEALLRWQSSDFGYMLPAEFIALTENTGLIVKIGEWVLRTACGKAREWAAAGYPELRIAVNISGQQLKQPDFVDMLEKIIGETGIDPSMIEIELTEHVVMQTSREMIGTLETIKQMGIQLSIDDFGTGYSCLSNLRHFSIDKLKIDRSFIAGVNRSRDDAAIVEAIISMAHSLNLGVVAEGVEHGDQLHFLTGLKCDEVQGFFLGSPMSEEDLLRSMKNGFIVPRETGQPDPDSL